jgi:hypothetical protein
MVEIARRILEYKAVKGDGLYTAGSEEEIQLLDDINGITLRYVTDAQNRWKEDTSQIPDTSQSCE